MACDVIFADIAARQLASIPPAARTAPAAAVDEIAADPYRGRRYHPRYPPELRTMTFGNWGLLAYVIREQRRRVIVLDLTWAR